MFLQNIDKKMFLENIDLHNTLHWENNTLYYQKKHSIQFPYLAGGIFLLNIIRPRIRIGPSSNITK